MDLNEQGSRLYAAGDYRRAVELFLQAYAVNQDPNLLFNIASCYEGLGDRDAALEKYRAFLQAPDAEPEGRPRAERAIERLLRSPSAPAVTGPSAAPEPPRGDDARTALPEDHAPRATKPAWVPWVGLGTGVAFGALGTTLYLMGAADHADVTGAQGYDDPSAVISLTRSRADDLIESGDTKKALGVASLSMGAALVTGSLLWWLLDDSDDSDDAAAAPGAAHVAVDASGVAIALSGRF